MFRTETPEQAARILVGRMSELFEAVRSGKTTSATSTPIPMKAKDDAVKAAQLAKKMALRDHPDDLIGGCPFNFTADDAGDGKWFVVAVVAQPVVPPAGVRPGAKPKPGKPTPDPLR